MAIGVKASTSLSSLELTMAAILNGTCSKEYILELVALETDGKSRAEKVNRTLRRMTVNNPLLKFIQEHTDEFIASIKGGANRTIAFTALMSAAYPLFYDTLSILGKYFHAQDEVSTSLIFGKLSEKYGASVDCTIGFNSAIKMLVDAGIIERPQAGIYKACRVSNISEFAKEMYKQSFLLNNPTLQEIEEINGISYFEFINN